MTKLTELCCLLGFGNLEGREGGREKYLQLGIL